MNPAIMASSEFLEIIFKKRICVCKKKERARICIIEKSSYIFFVELFDHVYAESCSRQKSVQIIFMVLSPYKEFYLGSSENSNGTLVENGTYMVLQSGTILKEDCVLVELLEALLRIN